MEGPYLNPGFGCDRTSNPWAEGVIKEKYQPVIDAAYDLARVWCVAPEREGILDFVLDVKAQLYHFPRNGIRIQYPCAKRGKHT